MKCFEKYFTRFLKYNTPITFLDNILKTKDARYFVLIFHKKISNYWHTKYMVYGILYTIYHIFCVPILLKLVQWYVNEKNSESTP